jgi:hypothetical protein
VAQRHILSIIRPRASEHVGPIHSRSLKDVAKDNNNNNPGKPIDIDLSRLKSKTGQGYVESSDAYKKWTETLEASDLYSNKNSALYQFIKILARA